jgi:hypothetical protein
MRTNKEQEEATMVFREVADAHIRNPRSGAQQEMVEFCYFLMLQAAFSRTLSLASNSGCPPASGASQSAAKWLRGSKEF